MIIQCKSCSTKFIARDIDIPAHGRLVQCGYCSVTWHQMPNKNPTKKTKKLDKTPIDKIQDNDFENDNSKNERYDE